MLVELQQALVDLTSSPELVDQVRADPAILGAKISGSGLGDCAIGLGRTAPDFPHPVIPVELAARGLVVEEGDRR